jgi:non-ribosomal peptide synthetase component F
LDFSASLFSYNNFGMQRVLGGDAQVGRTAIHGGETNYGLTVHVEKNDVNASCSVVIVGNGGVFDAAAMQRIARYSQRIITQMLERAAETIDRKAWLDAEDLEHTLMRSSDTGQDLPAKCLHTLFDEQAERSPDAVAAVFGDREMSYRELRARADSLARRLNSLASLRVCWSAFVSNAPWKCWSPCSAF